MIKAKEHIESILNPRELKPLEEVKLQNFVSEFGEEEVISGINIATKYLQQGKKGKILEPSITVFFKRLGGILSNRQLPLIDQKIHHLNSIGKKKFDYWPYSECKIIITEYAEKLDEFGWEENKIIDDLDTEVFKVLQESFNWYSFKGSIEKWTLDVNQLIIKKNKEPEY